VHLQGRRWVGGCEPGMSNASGAGSGRGQCRGGERRPGGKPRARNGRASALKAVACPVRSSPVASAVPCQRPSGRRGAALGADARRGAAPAHTHKRRMGAAACGPAATHTTETRRRPHSAAAPLRPGSSAATTYDGPSRSSTPLAPLLGPRGGRHTKKTKNAEFAPWFAQPAREDGLDGFVLIRATEAARAAAGRHLSSRPRGPGRCRAHVW